MDGKERMAPQKHCCLITSSFRSATTVINKPTAGMGETDNTKHGNTAQYRVGMIMVSAMCRKTSGEPHRGSSIYSFKPSNQPEVRELDFFL